MKLRKSKSKESKTYTFTKGKAKQEYDYDPRRDGISQSMIALYLNCKEKFRQSICLGRTIETVSVPLIDGNISHGALDNAYSDRRSGKWTKLSQVPKLFPGWLSDSVKAVEDEALNKTSAFYEAIEMSKAIYELVLPLYFEAWYKEDKKLTWVFVEDEFKIPQKMEDGAIVFQVGKFDGAYENSRGKFGLFETKNKSRWSPFMEDLLQIDLQLHYYITALDGLGEREPTSVIYNIIRRAGLRRKVSESIPEFANRVYLDVKARPEFYFVRYPEVLARSDLKFYRARTLALMNEVWAWWRDMDISKRQLCYNSSSCDGKFGTCGFLPICSRDDASGFTIKPRPHMELSGKGK